MILYVYAFTIYVMSVSGITKKYRIANEIFFNGMSISEITVWVHIIYNVYMISIMLKTVEFCS